MAGLDLDRALTAIAAVLRRERRRDEPREFVLKRAFEVLRPVRSLARRAARPTRRCELLRDPAAVAPIVAAAKVEAGAAG
jgi:hypothetical protein